MRNSEKKIKKEGKMKSELKNNVGAFQEKMNDLWEELTPRERVRYLIVNNLRKVTYTVPVDKAKLIKRIVLKTLLLTSEEQRERFCDSLVNIWHESIKKPFKPNDPVEILISDWFEIRIGNFRLQGACGILVVPYVFLSDAFFENNLLFQDTYDALKTVIENALDEFLKMKDEENNRLKNQVEQLKSENNRLKNQVEQLQLENNQLKNQIEQLVLENNRIRSQIESIKDILIPENSLENDC
jgi:hypothetical protein